MFCRECGKQFEGQFCPDCGTQAKELPPPIPPPSGNAQLNGLAIAGMVLGIISLVLFCVGYLIPLAVIGLLLSFFGLKSTERTIAIAGVTISIAAIVLSVLILISGLSFLH